MANANAKLFQPIRVGRTTLAHRIVYPPLTRLRANSQGEHGALAVEHYAQRASVPGTLLITEGAFVAPQAGGMPHAGGIWDDAQVAGWRKARSPPQTPRTDALTRTATGCRRRAQERLSHLPPVVGSRARRTPGGA